LIEVRKDAKDLPEINHAETASALDSSSAAIRRSIPLSACRYRQLSASSSGRVGMPLAPCCAGGFPAAVCLSSSSTLHGCSVVSGSPFSCCCRFGRSASSYLLHEGDDLAQAFLVLPIIAALTRQAVEDLW